MNSRNHASWQKRILLFLTSQCITLFGSTLVQMALIWYAAMETASGTWVAAFTLCSYLPQFLTSFLGGAWADRYPGKVLIIGADALTASATLFMALAMKHFPSEPALLRGLLVMSAVRSVGAGIQTPAVQAVIPRLVPADQLARYAFSDRLIGKLLIIYGLFTFFCVPAGYLAGLFVRRVFGETYWYLSGVELTGFAGMTAGGIVMSIWGGFRRRSRTLAASLFAFGLFALGMGLPTDFILYLILMLFYGIALTMAQTSLTTMLQENTAPAVQGRVFGLLSTMYAGFLPAGMAVFGPLADILPLRWVMAGSGLALMILAGIVIGSRQLRNV